MAHLGAVRQGGIGEGAIAPFEPATRRSKLVFIHVGKTAGTSLRLLLSDAFGQGACSDPFVQTYMTAEEALRLSKHDVVAGHISRTDQLKWFPDRHVITVLREPIDRCLSFIHYVRSLPPQSARIAADAKAMPIMDFIESAEAQHNLHNTMVRQLGGHMLDLSPDMPAALELAKQTLQDALWVGRQETIGRDLNKLADLLDVSLTMRRENVTPDRPSFEAEPPELLNRLYALNGYDLQLWRWAQHALF